MTPMRFSSTSGRDASRSSARIPLRSSTPPGVYPRVYSGRVELRHARHVTDYAVTCDECHHVDSFDSDVGPDNHIEITDCIECHEARGLVYGRKVDELDPDEVVIHRANVMHELCVGCHEERSARNHSIIAPIACRGCHAQRQVDYTLTESTGD